MAQVAGTAGEGRGLLGRGEGVLAGSGPGAPVGDGGQVAAPDTGEQAPVAFLAELAGWSRSSLVSSGWVGTILTLSMFLRATPLLTSCLADAYAKDTGGTHPDEVRRYILDPRLEPGIDERRALGLGIQMMCRSRATGTIHPSCAC